MGIVVNERDEVVSVLGEESYMDCVIPINYTFPLRKRDLWGEELKGYFESLDIY